MGDLFYQLGAAIGGFGSHLPGKPGAAPADDTPSHDPDDDDPFGDAGGMVAGAAGAWLLSRVLRPRPVSWARVVIAGAAATVLAELVRRSLEQGGRSLDRLADEDPEWILARLGAGVALAAGYASLLYPRLPGSPLARGLAFGALEIAAAPRGGLARMAAGIPGLRYPLQGLAMASEEEHGPLSRMAFGLGLGLLYRYDDD